MNHLEKPYKRLPKKFGVKQYMDLNSVTKLKSITHYKNNDPKENNKYKYENLPIDFNAKTYIELNEDLLGMTDLEAINHYKTHGYKENRSNFNYSKVFN